MPDIFSNLWNMALNYGMRSLIKSVEMVFEAALRFCHASSVVPRLGVRVFDTGRCTAFGLRPQNGA